MNALANDNCAGLLEGGMPELERRLSAQDIESILTGVWHPACACSNYGDDSESHSCRLVPRFVFIFCVSAAFLLLRWVDPVVAGSWLPFRTSCGAITGLPCIFCGMTRALHLLFNGDFSGAIYFNWLAFPFLVVAVFLIALFAVEVAKRRVIVNLSMILPVTFGRLTVIGLCLFLLWTSQAYLAVSQHKHELLNPRGPLYPLFVR